MTTRRIEITCSPNVDNLDEDRRVQVEAPSGVSMDDLLNTAVSAAHALAAVPSSTGKPWALSDLVKLKEDWGKGNYSWGVKVGDDPKFATEDPPAGAWGFKAGLLGDIGRDGRPVPARVSRLLEEAREVDRCLAAGGPAPLSALGKVRVEVIDHLHEFTGAAYCPPTDHVAGRIAELRSLLGVIDRLAWKPEDDGDELKEGDSIYV